MRPSAVNRAQRVSFQFILWLTSRHNNEYGESFELITLVYQSYKPKGVEKWRQEEDLCSASFVVWWSGSDGPIAAVGIAHSKKVWRDELSIHWIDSACRKHAARRLVARNRPQPVPLVLVPMKSLPTALLVQCQRGTIVKVIGDMTESTMYTWIADLTVLLGTRWQLPTYHFAGTIFAEW